LSTINSGCLEAIPIDAELTYTHDTTTLESATWPESNLFNLSEVAPSHVPGVRDQEPPSSVAKRKDQDDSGTDDRAQPAKRQRGFGLGSVIKKFACPFYKHDPRKFSTERLCIGPGWEQVHRVKNEYLHDSPQCKHSRSLRCRREHVFRRHKLPNHYCDHCFETFPHQPALLHHVRQPSSCVVGNETPPSGISTAQAEKLRKRGKKSLSEVERWNEMYRIIFPDSPLPTSPCKMVLPVYFRLSAEDIIVDYKSESELQQLGDQLLIDIQTGVEAAIASNPHIAVPHFRHITDSVVDVVRNTIKDFLRQISDHRSNREGTRPSGASPDLNQLWPFWATPNPTELAQARINPGCQVEDRVPYLWRVPKQVCIVPGLPMPRAQFHWPRRLECSLASSLHWLLRTNLLQRGFNLRSQPR